MWIALLVVLMLAALGTGLMAAWCWFKASRVRVQPSWDIEPADAEASMGGWIAGSMTAFAESGRLNKIAALWTAVAVILGTVANLYGAYLSFSK